MPGVFHIHASVGAIKTIVSFERAGDVVTAHFHIKATAKIGETVSTAFSETGAESALIDAVAGFLGGWNNGTIPVEIVKH